MSPFAVPVIRKRNPWPAVLYVLMLVIAGGLFLIIRSYGESLVAPAGGTAARAEQAAGTHDGSVLLHVLAALVVVIVAGRITGRVFAKLHQPPVIGEVLAGILLGPSLLGHFAPDVSAYILPEAVAPYLAVVAQLGIVLYMFLVGTELDLAVLHKHGHATVAISHASIVAPFVLGAALALLLYPLLSDNSVPFTVFAMFLGTAMSITAFPVLARILTDRQMQRTELGAISLACAATDDVTAWCLLALVVGVAQAQVGSALAVLALTVIYVTVTFLVLRPLVARWGLAQGETLKQSAVVTVFVGLLASAWLTELIGIHAIFGAFLFGAMIPHNSLVAREFTLKLQDLVTIVLLPAFFAITGMRTEIGLIQGWQDWLLCLTIIVVATLGKFGGSLLAARASGLGWRSAAALGILMNTRGLMELIVLNIGLELQVISPRLFAMMVIMALVTTIATTPILHWLGVTAGEEEVA